MSAPWDSYEARCADDSDIPASVRHPRRPKTTAPDRESGAGSTATAD